MRQDEQQLEPEAREHLTLPAHQAQEPPEQRAAQAARSAIVDEASQQSFPASDAPGWIPLRVGD